MTAVAWMRSLTLIFLAAVDSLSDDDLAEPTALRGWNRAHVIAHVDSNADALRRLVRWARTGEERRMYASSAQRADDIAAGAQRPPAELRASVRRSADALDDDLVTLTPEQTAHIVVTAQGRHIEARDITWLRCREVAVHAVDLDAGVTFDTFSSDFLEALAHDVVARRTAQGEAATLVAWLTGRGRRGNDLGPWL